ncbi:MAG: class I SAM-dependent methyltransferase [Desulfomonilaceae bacterium]|jgi:release factor glutamine methyltransferase
MRTAEVDLWLSMLKPFYGLPRLRWIRLALAGVHFQVDAVSFVHDHIFDSTSLLLRKGIRKYSQDGQRVLDLGTGHLGLLAVYCARSCGAQVLAVDVNEEFLENARIVARASAAEGIEFRRSDWFANVDGQFDLMFGNVPYVPADVGFDGAHSHDHPEIWNGGTDGLDSARVILKNAANFLSSNGKLLLGIDAYYVPRLLTIQLINDSTGLELKEIMRSWISKSEVYVIGHKPLVQNGLC